MELYLFKVLEVIYAPSWVNLIRYCMHSTARMAWRPENMHRMLEENLTCLRHRMTPEKPFRWGESKQWPETRMWPQWRRYFAFPFKIILIFFSRDLWHRRFLRLRYAYFDIVNVSVLGLLSNRPSLAQYSTKYLLLMKYGLGKILEFSSPEWDLFSI